MRMLSLGTLLYLLSYLGMPADLLADNNVIRACAHKQTGQLRLSPSGSCQPAEAPIEWNVQATARPMGQSGPAPASAIFLQSTGSVTAYASGPSVAIPGLAATMQVKAGFMLWVQGDFYQHQSCAGYLNLNYGTDPWALDLEVDGVVVATREILVGGVYLPESKPFTWLSNPLAGGNHSIRFLLRPPVSDYEGITTPPFQALVCLGTDGPPGHQSRAVLLQIPGSLADY